MDYLEITPVKSRNKPQKIPVIRVFIYIFSLLQYSFHLQGENIWMTVEKLIRFLVKSSKK
jgi:hypothetical protein